MDTLAVVIDGPEATLAAVSRPGRHDRRRPAGGGRLERDQHRHRASAMERTHAAVPRPGLPAGARLRVGRTRRRRRRRLAEDQIGEGRFRTRLVRLQGRSRTVRRARRGFWWSRRRGSLPLPDSLGEQGVPASPWRRRRDTPSERAPPPEHDRRPWRARDAFWPASPSRKGAAAADGVGDQCRAPVRARPATPVMSTPDDDAAASDYQGDPGRQRRFDDPGHC